MLLGPNDYVLCPSYIFPGDARDSVDCSEGGCADSCTTLAAFSAAYVNLVKALHAHWGDCAEQPRLFSVLGGSGNGLDRRVTEGTKDAVTKLHAEGIEIHPVAISDEEWLHINGCVSAEDGSVKCSGLTEYNGCAGHYNEAGHTKLMEAIAPAVGETLGWIK